MKVYRTIRQSRLHFDEHCPAMTASASQLHPVQELELSEVTSTRRFCLTCSPPGLPQLPQLRHRACLICYPNARAKPCAHNGGVLVAVTATQHSRNGNAFVYTYRKYRWPENTCGAPLVETGVNP